MPTYHMTVYRGYEIAVNLTRMEEPGFRIERIVLRHRLSTHSIRLSIGTLSNRDFNAYEAAFALAIARARLKIEKILSRRAQYQ